MIKFRDPEWDQHLLDTTLRICAKDGDHLARRAVLNRALTRCEPASRETFALILIEELANLLDNVLRDSPRREYIQGVFKGSSEIADLVELVEGSDPLTERHIHGT